LFVRAASAVRTNPFGLFPRIERLQAKAPAEGEKVH
jgi:hypothetical protein